MIAREAVRTGCDLIVIGSRGMTAAANLVLGSTATKVLHVSSLPVTVVK
jgi:nucleotide-binding universal stress UspA family protein